MRDSSVVYMSLGMLLLRPPRRVPYHRIDRHRAQWPTYPEDMDHPGFAIPTGVERQWTACGLLIYEYPIGEPIARIDNARLVGRPCRPCWRSWV